MPVKAKTRESNFELLRIVAMFMIVLYHILLFLPPPYRHPFYTALQLPLHIGVVLFVLISGYFHIHFSFKGIVKLLLPVFVIHVPIVIYNQLDEGESHVFRFLESFCIVTNTPYWFIRTYLYLFLFAPMINRCLLRCEGRFRWYMLLSLVFISIYVGMWHTDSSLSDGKNLINFILIYMIGDTVRNSDFLNKIELWKIGTLYVVYNVFIIVLYMIFQRGFVISIFYPYNSIGLYVNAVLLFVFFAKLKFYSKWVNVVAASMFSVYVIHQEPVIWTRMMALVTDFYDAHSSPYLFLVFVFFFSLLIMAISVAIDKLLNPVWKFANVLAGRLDSKIPIKDAN